MYVFYREGIKITVIAFFRAKGNVEVERALRNMQFLMGVQGGSGASNESGRGR